MKSPTRASAASLLLLAMASNPLLQAATHVSSSTTGTNTWSSGTGWDSAPVSGIDTALVFGNGTALAASAAVVSSNDIVGAFKLNSLNMTYAGPASGTAPTVTLSGTQLEFINSSGAVAPTLVFNTTGTVKPTATISNAILFTNTTAITTTTDGALLGVLSGAGSFNKAGAGILKIQNNSTSFAGNVGVSAGTLAVGFNGGFGDLGTGTVTLSGTGNFSVIRASNNFTLNNTITGTTTGAVNFQGNSGFTLTIGKANTYTAATNISAFATGAVGTVKLGVNNGLSTSTALTIGNLGTSVQTFDLAGFDQTIGSLATSGGGSTTNSIVTNSGTAKTLTISNATGSTTFAGLISGNVALTKSGASTQTLSGANTYSGVTTVNGGTLATSTTGSFGSSNITVGTASLNLGNNTSIADTASLFLSSTSTLNLGFASGFETISGLFIAGNAVSSGTYTAAQLGLLGLGGTFTGAGSLQVTSAIPEPSTYAALAGLGILGFALRRRSRA